MFPRKEEWHLKFQYTLNAIGCNNDYDLQITLYLLYFNCITSVQLRSYADHKTSRCPMRSAVLQSPVAATPNILHFN
jgi:hypothetical protein